MINLDDFSAMQAIDSDHMLTHIDRLPSQFERAWQHAKIQPLPDLSQIRQVVISGMGGSAIGGDLLAAIVADSAPIPITVIRGYTLPAWVQGSHTLFIASSFSGNTEETLSAYQQANTRGVEVIGITTGGKLAQELANNQQTVWLFPDEIGHPRAALGWSLGLLLGLAWRAGWAPYLKTDYPKAVAHLKEIQPQYQAETPIARNAAKRLAGQLIDRLPIFVGGGAFEVVAKRWKTQLNENSNTWGCYEPMPEMNHNAVVGVEQPEKLISKLAALFITSNLDHPRVQLRHKLTSEQFMQAGLWVDSFTPSGESLLSQVLHAILFGDYLSFYVAMAYQVDPAIIAPIKALKEALSQQ
ncbi:MAG: bifunctional phosphoglucose/phosphomannose isomerase [Phototrophicales bacterium]|nr:MAG: bifunctional phosphoglucose/phosphomannose isomerase [Phototrophicales bacterium]